jgi:predicted DNA-binding transcriptional regulator YafY
MSSLQRTNKSSDAGKLLRIFRLLHLLWNTANGLRVEEIARLQEVSKRTAYRDLLVLEESGFVLLRDERSGRIRLGKAKDSAQMIGFDKSEAELLLTAVTGLPATKGRERLVDKLRSFGFGPSRNTNQTGQRHYAQLHQAIQKKVQVLLMDYRSAHSKSSRHRRIEPYAFTDDLSSVLGYEAATSSNKTFKLERIGEVRPLTEPWAHEFLHQPSDRDPFGLPLQEEQCLIRLQLGNLSAQLLQEEFPAAARHLQALNTHHPGEEKWLFEIKVSSMAGIGRFVLGLIDDIEILEPASFKTFLRQRIGNKIR